MRAGLGRSLAVVLALGFAILAVRGLFLAGYGPVTSDAYVWGAFHVHSTLSDGLASIEEIAREAKEARVGFVMLSDHGAPHPEAAVLKRTIDGVRFIGGSEVGLPDGHLILSALREVPRYTLPPFPPDAVADAAAWGGISVVTYPEDPVYRWSYWEDDLVPDGIEIVNVTSYFRRSSFFQKLSWAFFSLFNRNYYISGFEAPKEALARWDQLLARGRVNGFYAVNAHGGFPLTEARTIGIPSYRTAMGYVGLAIDPRYREAPEEAIRRGEFFSLVRAAGEPERFEFRLEESEGAIVVQLEEATGLARIDLKRNRDVVSSTNERELRLPAPEPGVYRVEVYLEDHPLLAGDVPWILSNPIFVGRAPSPASREPAACGAVDPLALDELRLEMDDESEATIEYESDGPLKLSYSLSAKTPEKIDRWVALALRKPMDLSRFRGIEIRGGSPEPMRYWIEVRSGDDGHYASVLLPGASVIPWERFYPTLGPKRVIPLATIDALFLTVNTSSSRTGFSSELTLESLRFCR